VKKSVDTDIAAVFPAQTMRCKGKTARDPVV